MYKPNNIDDFISTFPPEVQILLEKLRVTIKKATPGATETISYGIPTFVLNGNLVHFSAYKNHIGFYPGAAGIEAFKKELSVYKGAKGSVQFPLDKPLPFALITKIVKFRVKQNKAKAESKNDFLSSLSAPAKRALENKGIKTLKQLSKFSEAEILKLHGMGPGSIPKLRSALKKNGLAFKK